MNSFRNATALVAALAVFLLAGCDRENAVAKEHRVRGNQLLKEEKWSEAAQEFERSLQADPAQEKLWEKKAFAHMKAGKTDAAAQALLKTLDFKTEPEEKVKVYRNIAGIYVQRGPLEKAEQYFLEGLKVDPNNDELLTWLGEIFSQLGGARAQAAPAIPAHLDKAIAYYDQAIAANPDAPTPYLNKRIALIKYIEHLKTEKARYEQEAEVHAKAKDQAKADEMRAKAEQAQARMDELMPTFQENDKKLGEVNKRLAAQPKK